MKVLMLCAALLARDIPFQVMTTTEITSQVYDEMLTGNLPTAVVELGEGTLIPLRLSLQGTLIDLEGSEEAPYFVRIKSRLYLRFEQENSPLFSTDLIQWVTFEQLATGTLSAVFRVDDAGPFIGLSAAIDRRQEANGQTVGIRKVANTRSKIVNPAPTRA